MQVRLVNGTSFKKNYLPQTFELWKVWFLELKYLKIIIIDIIILYKKGLFSNSDSLFQN